jgi:hypothetical protein
MYVDQQQTNWAKFLPVLAHSYRTTVNCVTGYSPFFALHGREARQPADQWITEFSTNQLRLNTSIDDYVHNLQKAMLSCWECASDHRLKSHLRADRARQNAATRSTSRAPTASETAPPTSPDHPADNLDDDDDPHPDTEPLGKLVRRFIQYAPGDSFFLARIPKRDFKDPTDEALYKVSRKLQNRYTGPHTVIAQLNPVQYLCRINDKEKRVHINKMKRDRSSDLPQLEFLHHSHQPPVIFDGDAEAEDQPNTTPPDSNNAHAPSTPSPQLSPINTAPTPQSSPTSSVSTIANTPITPSSANISRPTPDTASTLEQAQAASTHHAIGYSNNNTPDSSSTITSVSQRHTATVHHVRFNASPSYITLPNQLTTPTSTSSPLNYSAILPTSINTNSDNDDSWLHRPTTST